MQETTQPMQETSKAEEGWEKEFEKSFNRRHTQMTHLQKKSVDCEVCVEDRAKNPKGYSLTFLSEGSYWNRGLFEDIKSFIRQLLLSARQEADQRVAEAVQEIGRLLETPHYNKDQTYDTGVKEALSVLKSHLIR